MKKSTIGWAVITIVALVWEILGVYGVDGIWPLTWDTRLFLDKGELAVLVVFLVIVGAPAWLVYHFFVEPRKYPGSKN